MKQKHTIRTLISELRHLRDQECHNEARMKLALAFNRFDEARILTCLDIIQGCERHLPRSIEVYRGIITMRLLRHIRDHEGQQVADRILAALTIKQEQPIC